MTQMADRIMQPGFEQQWRAARTHENNGDHQAAWDIYQSLIKSDPDRLYVRLRLSALEQTFGHYRESRAHASLAAATVRKGRWADLAPVARRLLSFGEDDRVHDLIAAADWNSPDVIRASAALSQYLWLTGHVEEALRLIDIARVRAPSSHVLSYSRANALRYLGRMPEASEEYERCIALKPDYAVAHWSLAYHVRSDPPGARIGRIRRAQAALAPDAPDQPYLHYALFREYDDAGDTAAAWQSLQAGAQCKRRQTPYSSGREQQGFDALHRLFADGVRPAEPLASDASHTPIFIVGMPRTGTTLLERIVGSHGPVLAAGELNDFDHVMALEADRFPETAISAPMVEALAGADLARAGANYLRRTRRKAAGHAFMIDKNPRNFVNAGFIGGALPHARILCLRRAPMDACFSNLKELFSNDAYGYSYALDELAAHYRRFNALCELWQQAMPDRFMTVEYESLVSDPQAEAARIMAFCGIAFDASCVDITRNTAPVATASSSQVRQPINTRGIGAWRRYAAQLQPLRDRLAGSAPAVE